MILPDYDVALKLAECLYIIDQKTGQLLPFVLNEEQRVVLQALCENDRVIVLKGRQVGCSTVGAFFCLLLCTINPGLPAGIIADTMDNAEGILKKIRDWLEQLNIPLKKDNVRSIELANGATVLALTANSKAVGTKEAKAGQSRSFGYIHSSEHAYWNDGGATWSRLTAGALSKSIHLIESTGTFGEDNDFTGKWYNGEGFKKIFIGVELHSNYQLPENTISDDTWHYLRETYRFTNRATAAWWYVKLTTDFSNDVNRMLREYPVVPEHAFVYSDKDRHIKKYIETSIVVKGDWNYYPAYKSIKEPLIVGVDVAFGVGGDASAIAIIGHKTGKIHATYRDSNIEIPDLIKLIRNVIWEYEPLVTIIESNGLGGKVCQYLSGHNIIRHHSAEDEKAFRRSRLKGDIELGEIVVGGHLIQEILSSTVNEKRKPVKYEGMDDLLSALSFAREYRYRNPYKEPPPDLDPTIFNVRKDIFSKKKKNNPRYRHA